MPLGEEINYVGYFHTFVQKQREMTILTCSWAWKHDLSRAIIFIGIVFLEKLLTFVEGAGMTQISVCQ